MALLVNSKHASPLTLLDARKRKSNSFQEFLSLILLHSRHQSIWTLWEVRVSNMTNLVRLDSRPWGICFIQFFKFSPYIALISIRFNGEGHDVLVMLHKRQGRDLMFYPLRKLSIEDWVWPSSWMLVDSNWVFTSTHIYGLLHPILPVLAFRTRLQTLLIEIGGRTLLSGFLEYRWNIVPPSESSGWTFQFKAARDEEEVPPGIEATISYGDHSSQSFLLHYGFVPPRNTFDTVVLFKNTEEAIDWFLDRFPPEVSLPRTYSNSREWFLHISHKDWLSWVKGNEQIDLLNHRNSQTLYFLKQDV